MHQVAPLHCGNVVGANSKILRKVSESVVLGLGTKCSRQTSTLLWLETRPVYGLWCVGSIQSATVQTSALSHNPRHPRNSNKNLEHKSQFGQTFGGKNNSGCCAICCPVVGP